jgi:hypothetical protein
MRLGMKSQKKQFNVWGQGDQKYAPAGIDFHTMDNYELYQNLNAMQNGELYEALLAAYTQQARSMEPEIQWRSLKMTPSTINWGELHNKIVKRFANTNAQGPARGGSGLSSQVPNATIAEINLNFFEDVKTDKSLKLTYRIGKIETTFFRIRFMWNDIGENGQLLKT